MTVESAKAAQKVTLVGLGANAALCVMKLAVGFLAHSSGLISDAVNSASDVLNTLIAMIGVRIGNKQADADHPYGHARFECVASLLLAFLVFATGLGIGWNGVKAIVSGGQGLEIPGLPALIAAVAVCIAKELLYWYTIRAAKKLDSLALKASAWDHRSDVFAALGVFAGILGARLGVPVLDAVASVIICVLILRVAVKIFLEAVSQTVDQACEPELEGRFRTAALSQGGVRRVDELRSRRVGPGVYVDMEIAADGNLSLKDAHDIAERVHDAVEACEPGIRHCMVHVNPYSPEDLAGAEETGNRP